MGVYINFICDEKDCKTCQPASFDLLTETWTDMIQALTSAGWTLEMADAKIIKAHCPNHK